VVRGREPMTDEASTEAEANVARLRELLDLRRLEFTSASSETDFFIGASQYKPDGRVYGGQVLAQCVVAAAATLPQDRHIHSLHGYSPRAGDVRAPIEFGVGRLRDRRSWSARRGHAYQKGVPVPSLIAACRDEE